MRKCPNCRSWVAETGEACACGHVFPEGASPAPPDHVGESSRRPRRDTPSEPPYSSGAVQREPGTEATAQHQKAWLTILAGLSGQAAALLIWFFGRQRPVPMAAGSAILTVATVSLVLGCIHLALAKGRAEHPVVLARPRDGLVCQR